MPLPLPESIRDAVAAAEHKAQAVRDLPRYLVQAALAGAYVGAAVVLLLSVAGPLAVADSPSTKLVGGAVFGLALTLVVFAGAELVTGNVMFMVQGWWARRVRGRDVGAVLCAALVGNLAGSVLLAAAVHGSGVLDGAPSGQMLARTVAAKSALAGGQLLWRSVLCNVLVCLGLWMATRTRSDAAKLVVVWWALLAFVASGFEHSVANVTVFALGILQGDATVTELLRNLAWTVPGNLLGGGVFVGLGYAWIGGRREPAPAAAAWDVPGGRHLDGVPAVAAAAKR